MILMPRQEPHPILGATFFEGQSDKGMELEADDGYVVSIPRGCKKELGRGPGIATRDRTVSRHQILVELQELSSDSHTLSQCRLNVRVLGPNPVCIIHSRKDGAHSATNRTFLQEPVLLRKGEADVLSVGDKISLSIRLPLFFTVKEEGHRVKEANSTFIERSGSSAGMLVDEERVPKLEVREGEVGTDNELMAQWNARKKEKPTEVQDERDESLEQRTRLSPDKKGKAVANEEEGIAEAIARRQKRAHDRRLQQQQQSQGGVAEGLSQHQGRSSSLIHSNAQEGEMNESSRLSLGASNIVKLLDEEEGDQNQPVDTRGIDPVKEFGFLVEGSEFEQYKKKSRQWRGRWSWHHDEGQGAGDVADYRTPHSRKRHKSNDDDDDDEWSGESLWEKETIGSGKTSKSGKRLSLRSHDLSSLKKGRIEGSRASVSKEAKEDDDDEDDGDDDDDDEDETLGGFIVDDEDEDKGVKDEQDLSEEEEEDENSGNDDNDEDDDIEPYKEEEDVCKAVKTPELSTDKGEGDERPLCKYGKKCYRKNKEHLDEYRHY